MWWSPWVVFPPEQTHYDGNHRISRVKETDCINLFKNKALLFHDLILFLFEECLRTVHTNTFNGFLWKTRYINNATKIKWNKKKKRTNLGKLTAQWFQDCFYPSNCSGAYWLYSSKPTPSGVCVWVCCVVRTGTKQGYVEAIFILTKDMTNKMFSQLQWLIQGCLSLSKGQDYVLKHQKQSWKRHE